jgi:prepilin-type processing-associated H-X9-DG protein
MSVLDLARRYYPEAMQYLYQENLTLLSSDLWQAESINERFQIWWLVSCNDLPGLADYLKSHPAFKAQRVLSQLCEPAIVAGHTDMLRFLLDQGVDPNYEYKATWSHSLTWVISRYFLLELTVKQGQVEMAALLLARGAAVDKERLGGRVTAAMIAAEQGSVEMMALLLTHGANLKQVNAPGEGLIYQAASKGHKAVVEQLYLAGAPIDPGSDRPFFNSSALSKAAAGEHWGVVYFLLDHDPDVAKKIDVGRPIASAAGKGKLDVVRRLLFLGADVNVDYSSPLKNAVRHGHIDMARLLIKHGADVNARQNPWDATPLAEAVKAGDEAMVRLLLDSGAKIDSGGEEYRNLLCCALREKNFAVATLLLARGADIEQKIERGRVYEALSNRVEEKAYTPLQWAVYVGDAEQVRFLLKQGADIEARCDSSGSTPLMLAAEHGQAHLVGLLVRHGAQVNALRADGHTAYSLSKLRCQCEGARRRHWDTKDKLISVGADPKKACFNIGRSALEVAASRGDLSAVRELLSLSPEVPKPSLWQSRVRRDMALHNAAEKGHIPVVRELVNKAGYDVNGKDCWGRLPLHLAVQSNQLEMTLALLTAGADMNARDGAGKTAYNYACLLEDKTILRRLLPDPVSPATQSARCRVM